MIMPSRARADALEVAPTMLIRILYIGNPRSRLASPCLVSSRAVAWPEDAPASHPEAQSLPRRPAVSSLRIRLARRVAWDGTSLQLLRGLPREVRKAEVSPASLGASRSSDGRLLESLSLSCGLQAR